MAYSRAFLRAAITLPRTVSRRNLAILFYLNTSTLRTWFAKYEQDFCPGRGRYTTYIPLIQFRQPWGVNVPDVRSFIISGLAGRGGLVAHELNSHVNVFFGPNGSGKTSLLRILHSALSNDASLAKSVSFQAADVHIYSYHSKRDYSYSFTKQEDDKPPENRLNTRRNSLINLSAMAEKPPTWKIDPPDGGAWFHKYLPIARLYEKSQVDPETYWSGSNRQDTEQSLEARFAENLKNTWKDYSTEITNKVNQIQEAGLARILASVITRSESKLESGRTEPSTAYSAVSAFLTRRNMSGVQLSREEFFVRYKADLRLRSVATDIQAIEKEISEVMAPREALKTLVSEMFYGNKSLQISDSGIDVDVEGKRIDLSLLSSGEKQLLKVLVDTVIAGPSIVLLDEPELSMHIDWQRQLVSMMRLLNPVAQLIIATHSPEIMADLPDDQIFKL
jgi:predicted ATP-dependent endonuclease of OLD family